MNDKEFDIIYEKLRGQRLTSAQFRTLKAAIYIEGPKYELKPITYKENETSEARFGN